MKTLHHRTDFCVVGGGMAGICAALAAARNGIRTVLVQDRPVLGGNASSEIRMWICGAHGDNRRETGILEELLLENLYRNEDGNYSIWDSVLYGKVRYQQNLTLLLNTTCVAAETAENRIVSISGWELNAETRHEIEAACFADCSGDSILATLSGAETRYGREAAAEFGEDIAPAEADRRTMGLSCLIQARETAEAHDFIAPEWAEHYTGFDRFPNRGAFGPDAPYQNYWWLELGGAGDALHDAADARDALLKVGFGLWELIKHHPDTRDRYRNWVLEWVGFLPGKRESRRYVGDWTLTQHDVRAEGRFPDLIAYGGWSMDDHHPDGLLHPGAPTIFHPAPSPFGIPYRCCYSRNVENLFCAGRNISCTHTALSSTRVMGTCATLGHAVGVAAALAVRHATSPRGVHQTHLAELQRQLMREDAWLPGFRYPVSEPCRRARLTASNRIPAEGVRAGVNRITEEFGDLSWRGKPGDRLIYEWDEPRTPGEVRVVLDSELNRSRHNIVAMRPLHFEPYRLPPTLPESLTLEFRDNDGEWHEFFRRGQLHERLLRVPCAEVCRGLRLTLGNSRGAPEMKVFAFDFGA